MTRTKSILARKNKIFVPVPKEQQITEKILVELEHRIAKSVYKNDAMLDQSEKLASCSII